VIKSRVPHAASVRGAAIFTVTLHKTGLLILEEPALAKLVTELLIILAVGLAAGIVCRRLGASLMIGYMVAGALIGEGVLNIVGNESNALEGVARTGALLLLFSIGIEFSIHELLSLGRPFLVGGAAQMLLSAIPVAIVSMLFGMHWQGALLVAFAAALSSTVLVFKGIAELGELESPAGRRAMAILLFQDVALVPLILLAPMLSGHGPPPTLIDFLELGAKSAALVASVLVVRWLASKWALQLLAELRSTELICLFAVVMLAGACITADMLGLPPAIGALAAGVAFSGSRLSPQIDSILLPFRETFAAVFFVTLGALMRPAVFFDEPLLMTLGLVGMIAVKASAAAVALRLAGLKWPSAVGMGLGLAQLGEFSFLLLLEGFRGGVIDEVDYNRTLLIALGTLLATPLLLRYGMRWVGGEDREPAIELPGADGDVSQVLVIGAGPIGRDVAAFLETSGWRVTIMDLSPVNLQPFAQQGFRTVVGDACDPDALSRARIESMRLAIVCVPNDMIAFDVTNAIHAARPECAIIVRCRYLFNVATVRRAGAVQVVSEEAEAARALLAAVRRVLDDAG
jgi:CPA2 family monovalent cation:H+ antiporter-2